MRFLVDASSPARFIAHLQSLGHDVTRIASDYPAGISDTEVLTVAFRERRILITNDRDFGDLVFRQNLPQAGVIFFRSGYLVLSTCIAYLDTILREHPDEFDQYIVVNVGGQIRVRKTD